MSSSNDSGLGACVLLVMILTLFSLVAERCDAQDFGSDHALRD
jgi:hypothetical protein